MEWDGFWFFAAAFVWPAACVVLRRPGLAHLELGNGKETCILERCNERRGLLSPGYEKHGMMSDDDERGYKCNALILYPGRFKFA